MASLGCTTIGVSANGVSANTLHGFRIVSNANTTVTHIVAYLNNYLGVTVKGVLCDSSFNILENGITNAVYTASVNGSWLTLPFAVPPSIVDGQVYYAMVIGNAAIGYKYDAAEGSETCKTDTTNSYTTPTNPTDASNYAVKMSIYIITAENVQYKTISAFVKESSLINRLTSALVLMANQVGEVIALAWNDTTPPNPVVEEEVMGFTSLVTNSTTIYLSWLNPSNYGYSESILFGSETEDLSGKSYAYCLANATLVYSGLLENYTAYDMDVTSTYYTRIFTKYMDNGVPVYSTGVSLTTEKTVFLDAYWVSGDANWTAAIGRANTALTALGGGTMVFSDTDYLIAPTALLASNTKWRGVGSARLYTQETAVYGYAINCNTKINVTIENLIFDQRGDSGAALVPVFSPYRGLFMINIIYSNNIDIHDCTFHNQGYCAVYCDDWNHTLVCMNIDFHDNSAYYTNRDTKWYDVSTIHLQCKTLHYYNNYVESMVTDSAFHVARSAVELHFANGYAINNHHKGFEVGLLYNSYPSNVTDYDANYVGNVLISGNNLENCGAMGIEMWTGFGGDGRNLKNVTIENNTIGLYLKNNARSKPGEGIVFYKGGSYTTEAYDIIIRNNAINFTFDTSYAANLAAVRGIFNELQYGENTGAFNLNVNTTLRRIAIYGNTVSQFPYSILNLYRRNGGLVVHDNITFYSNTATNCAYTIPAVNITLSKACFTLGYSNIVTVINNIISNPNIALQQQVEQMVYLTNLTYSGNDFTT